MDSGGGSVHGLSATEPDIGEWSKWSILQYVRFTAIRKCCMAKVTFSKLKFCFM